MEKRKDGIGAEREAFLIKISSQNPNLLIRVLKDKNNKDMIIDLLRHVLNIGVNEIYNCEIEKFDNISEYKFGFIKQKIGLFDNEILEIYLRVINRKYIKESIFCSWCFFFEKELNKRKHSYYKYDNALLDKVLISEFAKERYKNSILLGIDKNKTGILKYGVELHFIDFLKYVENNKRENNNLEKWTRYIDKENKDILLIGMIPNKGISRSNIAIV